jgi:hypothetical protein
MNKFSTFFLDHIVNFSTLSAFYGDSRAYQLSINQSTPVLTIA